MQLELFRLRGAARPVERRPEPPRPEREHVVAKAEGLARELAAHLGAPVKLSVTDNRSTMISFKREASAYALRLHHMFLGADAAVVAALAEYVRRGRARSGRVLDAFIHGHEPQIRTRRTAATALVSRGRCFDLVQIFDDLNVRFFEQGITARIGWGKKTPKRRRRTIRLGVYDHQAREIRVHPALDHPDVPRFFVEYIVFHEMLHQLFPSERGDKRHVHHPQAFKDREKTFPHYDASLAWERSHLAELLRR